MLTMLGLYGGMRMKFEDTGGAAEVSTGDPYKTAIYFFDKCTPCL